MATHGATLILARSLCAWWLCVLAAGCDPGSALADIDAGDAHTSHDATSDGGAPPAGLFIPAVVGAWDHVFVPPDGRYLNDHTIALGHDGTWHVYGITNTGTGNPQTEYNFLHATAPSLMGPWTAQMDILMRDTTVGEVVLWAPYAFEPVDHHWVMYYWGGGDLASSPMRGLRRADSDDLNSWTRTERPNMPSPADRPPGGRDPFALRVGGEWLLYSVGVDDQAHGEILVSHCSDLTNLRCWSDPPDVAIMDPVPNFGWGNLESPFVVEYAGMYYLFLTRTADDYSDYVRTSVFRSADPTHFEFPAITDLRAHAAEIVVDAGDYYITSAGWPSAIGEANRGLLIARLEWLPE
jgi:beta-fructofuranosidase